MVSTGNVEHMPMRHRGYQSWERRYFDLVCAKAKLTVLIATCSEKLVVISDEGRVTQADGHFGHRSGKRHFQCFVNASLVAIA
jgi:hypothetical protein